MRRQFLFLLHIQHRGLLIITGYSARRETAIRFSERPPEAPGRQRQACATHLSKFGGLTKLTIQSVLRSGYDHLIKKRGHCCCVVVCCVARRRSAGRQPLKQPHCEPKCAGSWLNVSLVIYRDVQCSEPPTQDNAFGVDCGVPAKGGGSGR